MSTVVVDLPPIEYIKVTQKIFIGMWLLLLLLVDSAFGQTLGEVDRVSLVDAKGSALDAALGEAEEILIGTSPSESEEVSLVGSN